MTNEQYDTFIHFSLYQVLDMRYQVPYSPCNISVGISDDCGVEFPFSVELCVVYFQG